jgi:hypothetical protein
MATSKGAEAAAPKTAAEEQATPKEPAFSFDGTIVEEKPYIEHEAFNQLDKGTLVKGSVAYVEQYKGKTKAAILINGHTTRITLWDTTMDEAKRMVGDPITLKFGGMNSDGYPKLYPRW